MSPSTKHPLVKRHTLRPRLFAWPTISKMSGRRRGSPPFIPNHLTPNLWTSSTRCSASLVLNSLGAFAPVASTLQYLQRALQAPVALQEVINNGPLFAKQEFPFKYVLNFYIVYFSGVSLKKILRFPIFSALLAVFAEKSFSASGKYLQFCRLKALSCKANAGQTASCPFNNLFYLR